MPEHSRIQQYFAPLTTGEPGSFHLTDDAAVLTPPAGMQLVVTTDSVIEAIHVLPNATPEQYGQKLIRRNLSDLAAMGATPWCYSLNIHTPHGLGDTWFQRFTDCLAAEQQTFSMTLIGGDSTSAPTASIHVTMTCFGLLQHTPLRRSAAQPGDDLYVSGTIGDAALGLHLLLQNKTEPAALITRYHTPLPRLTLGVALCHIATAALDISDGLLADIGQLCTASAVGAIIEREAVPRSQEAQHMLQQNDMLWATILSGGDDYELCFTAPASARATITALAQQLNTPLTRIGRITQEKEIRLLDASGTALPLPTMGWQHR